MDSLFLSNEELEAAEAGVGGYGAVLEERMTMLEASMVSSVARVLAEG